MNEYSSGRSSSFDQHSGYDRLSPRQPSITRSQEMENSEEQINDVEIICKTENCQDYAEIIEKRLKLQGLLVDILFPNPSLKMQEVRDTIAGRGVKFLLIVDDYHVNYDTVDVFYNDLVIQEEFLSMNQCKAVTYIQDKILKNKTLSFIKDCRTSVSTTVIPLDVQTTLDFLQADRPLTILELDKLIKYFTSKRTEFLELEYGDYIPQHLKYPPVGPNHDPLLKPIKNDLVASLMDILNEKPVEAEATVSSSQVSTSNPLPISEKSIDEILTYVRTRNQPSAPLQSQTESLTQLSQLQAKGGDMNTFLDMLTAMENQVKDMAQLAKSAAHQNIK